LLLVNYLITDQRFKKQIIDLRPDWFEDTVKKNKETLLELAKSGARKPPSQSKLYPRLTSYIAKSQPLFDADFNQKIRELRPDWFEKTADKNRKTLLEMARNGAKKPGRETKIGTMLSCYMHRDPRFKKQIHNLRPDWFHR
jgi:hypothetical protein